MTTTISDVLKWAIKTLSEKNIRSARLDSLILLEEVTGLDRAKLLAGDNLVLPRKQINLFKEQIIKRSHHIPITQLTHSCEFYGRNYYINEFVMSPRPETERMIEIFLDLIGNDKDLISIKKVSAADVGTGSGAIGITVKKELPKLDVDLIDNDEKAIKVAKINVVLNTIDVDIIKSNLLEDTSKTYDVLFCNLPYVPDKLIINEEAKHEPKSAIFGGKDGLNIYRELFGQMQNINKKPLLILSEALPFSHTRLRQVAKKSGYEQLINDVFIQVFKLKNK